MVCLVFGPGLALSAQEGRVQGVRVHLVLFKAVLKIIQDWLGPVDGRELLWREGLLLEAVAALLLL